MSCLIYHYGKYEAVWFRPGLYQAGPNISTNAFGIKIQSTDINIIRSTMVAQAIDPRIPLIYYTDNFYLRSAPLCNIRAWPGPKILVCGDLHHGDSPLETLERYLRLEFFDAVLLLCNPSMLNQVRRMVAVPVRFLPPSFFKYESANRIPSPNPMLLHVGSIGAHHPHRKAIVEALISRKKIPFLHANTNTSLEAAQLYASHAILLNIPLNNDLNHRIYEAMAAGVPQIILGKDEILGDQELLALRSDLMWVESMEEVEEVAAKLLAPPYPYKNIEVLPPPVWDMDLLLKAALAPYRTRLGVY